jgi:CubicO group peptidase (beta-lactamase class C family)
MNRFSRRRFLKRGLATGFASIATPSWAETRRKAPNASDRMALEATARSFMKRYNVPGLSVAISQHGHLSYAEGFGLADKKTGEKVTTASLFRIASISKPITSAGIFSLVEKGRLKLSDKVFGAEGVLTEFALPSNRHVEEITVAHLLLHLGGGWSNQYEDPTGLHKKMSQRELISWTIENLPLIHRPGAHFSYSNFGYLLLGQVIEKISRRNYDDYIHQVVLAPCGIADMRIGGSSLAERADGEVSYYHDSWNPYSFDMRRIAATGGWLANAKDLVLFALHVDAFPSPPDILRLDTITHMTTPSAVNPRYAHGWAVLKSNWRHDGSLPGSTATLVRTQSGYCWAALANSSNAASNRGLDKMLWDMVEQVQYWSPGAPPHL